uniref:Uncharacterized protein n=1 Tax=Arundo donax TaxID=35708 RepID=A0A0A9C1Z1_ARUDO
MKCPFAIFCLYQSSIRS